jgi:hypothetical protein
MDDVMVLRSGLVRFVVGGALFAALVGTADAQQRAQPAPQAAPQPSAPKPIGTFDAWTSVELGPAASKVCYMFARPTSSEPKAARRGDIMLVITHRPSSKRQDEVSFQSGYPYKAGSKVAVDIDGKKFEFFTRPEVDAESAWSPDAAADKVLVAAMKAGKNVRVRGTSVRNTETVDVFSLAGFTKAHGEIGKACGIK